MFTFVQLVSILWYSLFPKKNSKENCILYVDNRCMSGDICGCEPIAKDPLKHCDVVKRYGCSHVDGYLCNVDTCDILKDYKKVGRAKVIPIKVAKKRSLPKSK